MIPLAPQVTLDELRDIALLATHGHYGRTAAALGISQPALTKRIAAVEARLGGRLFLRGRAGVMTTAAGRVLAEKGWELVAEANQLAQTTRSVLRGAAGSLRIGAGLSVMMAGLPELLQEFRRRHPEVQLSVRDMSSTQQRAALDGGELDVAFVRMEETGRPEAANGPSEPPKQQRVLTEELRIACSSRLAPLLRRDPKQLLQQPLVAVARNASPTLHEQVEAVCRQMAYRPPSLQEFNQVLMVLLMVQAGAGVALVPGAAQKLRIPGVVFLPQALPGGKWEIGLATAPEESNPLIARFCEAVPQFLRLGQ